LLRRGNYAERVGAGAPVYLAAVSKMIMRDCLTKIKIFIRIGS
jgi:hypothetical protein